MLDTIKVIAFDADDTLWENENYFREAEHQFCQYLKDYETEKIILEKLVQIEIQNMDIYGYGIKAFVLSLLETAITIANNQLNSEQVAAIIQLGKTMLNHEVVLLEGVEKVLKQLRPHYKLVVATKGDLLDQERKLKQSGLENYFHHVEIMTHKRKENYQQLLAHLDIPASQFLMIGNSLKSDVLPVIELGGTAIHIPYHTTWILEQVDAKPIQSDRFFEVKTIENILPLFGL